MFHVFVMHFLVLSYIASIFYEERGGGLIISGYILEIYYTRFSCWKKNIEP